MLNTVAEAEQSRFYRMASPRYPVEWTLARSRNTFVKRPWSATHRLAHSVRASSYLKRVTIGRAGCSITQTCVQYRLQT